MSERIPQQVRKDNPYANLPAPVRAFAALYEGVVGVGRLAGRMVFSVVEATRTFFRSANSSFVERVSPGRSTANARFDDSSVPERKRRSPRLLRDIQSVWRSPVSLLNKLASVTGMIIGALIGSALAFVKNVVLYAFRTARNLLLGRPTPSPSIGIGHAPQTAPARQTGPERGRSPNGGATRDLPLNSRKIDRLAEKLTDQLGVLSTQQAKSYIDQLQEFKLFRKRYSAEEIAAALLKTPFAHYTYLLGPSHTHRVLINHPLQITTSNGTIVEVNGRVDDLSYMKELMRFYGKDPSFKHGLAMAVYTRLPPAKAVEMAAALDLPRLDLQLKNDLSRYVTFRDTSLIYVHQDQYGHRVEHVLPYNEKSKEWVRQNMRDHSPFLVDMLLYRWDRTVQHAKDLQERIKAVSQMLSGARLPTTANAGDAGKEVSSPLPKSGVASQPMDSSLKAVFEAKPEKARSPLDTEASVSSSKPEASGPSSGEPSANDKPSSGHHDHDSDRKRQGGRTL